MLVNFLDGTQREVVLGPNVNLRAANLSGVNLRAANLRDADLSGADLSDAILSDATLRNATLRDAILCGADLRRVNLSGADLRRVNLSGATLRDAILCGADLRDVDLHRADLSGATLRGVNLCGATLSDATLSGVNFSGADLSGATLRGVNFSGVNLSGVNLSGATLRGANLSGADLRGAMMPDAWLDDTELSPNEDADAEENISLKAYDANPFNYFEWDPRNKPNALVFGVELEMEPMNASEWSQHAIIKALGGNEGENFILKSDGSLSWGVELVSMPFTLAQHLNGSGPPWSSILPEVHSIAKSGRDTRACGIHVHINKKALSALTIGKMLVFLNDSGLSPLVSTIAQRSSSQYAQRSEKKLTDGTRHSESRYDIMNVSVRHPTCEIRMFNGNLTPERLFKNLEFCHALVQYCRQSSMRTLCDWGQFSRWLIAHRGQYQHLVRFLIDKKTVGFRQLAKDSRDGQVTIEDR